MWINWFEVRKKGGRSRSEKIPNEWVDGSGKAAGSQSLGAFLLGTLFSFGALCFRHGGLVLAGVFRLALLGAVVGILGIWPDSRDFGRIPGFLASAVGIPRWLDVQAGRTIAWMALLGYFLALRCVWNPASKAHPSNTLIDNVTTLALE